MAGGLDDNTSDVEEDAIPDLPVSMNNLIEVTPESVFVDALVNSPAGSGAIMYPDFATAVWTTWAIGLESYYHGDGAPKSMGEAAPPALRAGRRAFRALLDRYTAAGYSRELGTTSALFASNTALSMACRLAACSPTTCRRCWTGPIQTRTTSGRMMRAEPAPHLETSSISRILSTLRGLNGRSIICNTCDTESRHSVVVCLRARRRTRYKSRTRFYNSMTRRRMSYEASWQLRSASP